MVTNLKEFKALIERYETITLEELKEIFKSVNFISTLGNQAAEKATGFGSMWMCTLCSKVQTDCNRCIYTEEINCLRGNLKKSYDRIENAHTPLKLRNAYRYRAKVLREIYADQLK